MPGCYEDGGGEAEEEEQDEVVGDEGLGADAALDPLGGGDGHGRRGGGGRGVVVVVVVVVFAVLVGLHVVLLRDVGAVGAVEQPLQVLLAAGPRDPDDAEEVAQQAGPVAGLVPGGPAVPEEALHVG